MLSLARLDARPLGPLPYPSVTLSVRYPIRGCWPWSHDSLITESRPPYCFSRPATLMHDSLMRESIPGGGGDVPAGSVTPLLFFFTLVTGPRRSLSLELSDTRVYEPQILGPLPYPSVTISVRGRILRTPPIPLRYCPP